jgi:hypothetical protein
VRNWPRISPEFGINCLKWKYVVMAALEAAIQEVTDSNENLDGRVKPGHDEKDKHNARRNYSFTRPETMSA